MSRFLPHSVQFGLEIFEMDREEVAYVGDLPQSRTFACNIEAVDATAKQLKDVADELEHFDDGADHYRPALGSDRVHGALLEFYDDSSDMRDAVKGSVGALAQMLQALSDGVHQVDQGLYDAMANPSTGHPGPAAE